MTVTKSNTINQVAVIGAGTMGAAITQHFLMKGLSVVLIDNQQQGLDRGLNNIDSSLSEAAERRIISSEQKAQILTQLHCSTDYQAIARCDFVVEAVFENFEVKQEVFRRVESVVSESCIIASNTSSFSITELGSVLGNRSRFVGVHYFYHAAKNKLIEVIPGRDTADDVVERLVAFYYSKEKAPIVVADAYGFAVNRFFVPWMNEATRLLEEGLGSIAVIDQVAEEVFQVGMGPFALMNATGVPITFHAAETLAAQFGPMYAPSASLRKQVDSGEDWDCSSIALIQSGTSDNVDQIKKRLLGITLGVAAQMVSEKVADASDTDLGARLGLSWPVGPFELMQQYGLAETTDIIGSTFQKWDQPLPAILADTARASELKVWHVKTHVVGTTGLIEFNRPDAMNALNEGVVSQLDDCFSSLENNENIEKIILFGRGKAFVAGADIKFFIENIRNGTIDNIVNFTRKGQRLFARIAGSSKQTIALLDGLALGGGLELALACQHRIATRRLTAAFPETGIGIYPGLGGTQRTTRLVGKGLAKFLVATGATLDVNQAKDYGLIDDVVEEVSSLAEVAALDVSDVTAASAQLPEAEFEDFNGVLTATLFDQTLFKRYEKMLKSKAPLALKKAMELIDEGADRALDQALQLELDGLNWMFSTQDALAGLSAVINRQRVEYQGV